MSKSTKINSIDAVVSNNTIIPGISGKEVDVDKSYSKMRRYGKYNEKLLEYSYIKPTVSLTDNIDKYIIINTT